MKRRKLWILVVALLALLACLVILAVVMRIRNRCEVHIQLNGQQEITVEYGTAYEEAGASAWVTGRKLPGGFRDLTSEITLEGRVDPSKVGIYILTYQVSCWENGKEYTASQQRTVRVVDTQAPVITLVEDPDGFTYPGQEYVEEGFSATDNCDGDLTHLVERTVENGVVTYRVRDSAGNETVVQRKIRYADLEAPVITLEGESVITIAIGAGFEEPGFTARDAYDGDLTARVEVVGSVQKYLAATYTLRYSVSDAAGNVATVERTVVVEPFSRVETVKPEGKVIYLTFDDGPGRYTKRLLEILDKYDVKATFFVVNTSHISTIQQIVEQGHAIGIHSYCHDYKEIYADEEAFFADLLQMQQRIYDYTGVETTLFRFPGGGSNTVSNFNPGIMTRLAKAVQDMGFQYFDWNVDSDDAGRAKDAATVAANVIKGCSNHRISIVLQHDIKSYSVEAVEAIIQWGLENGYVFLPLDPTSPTMHHGINN